MLQAQADDWQQEAAERLAAAQQEADEAQAALQASAAQAASLVGPLEAWAAGQQRALSSQQLELEQHGQPVLQGSLPAAEQQPSEELASLLHQLDAMERRPPLQRKLKNALSRCHAPPPPLQPVAGACADKMMCSILHSLLQFPQPARRFSKLCPQAVDE